MKNGDDFNFDNYSEVCDNLRIDPLDFLEELDDNMKYDLIHALLDVNGDTLGVQSDIQKFFFEWINEKPTRIDSQEDRGDCDFEIAKDNELMVTKNGC